ncbi:MAG: YraN family protein [Rudaea sp.]|nr:YraN family protein [Rudaea sp.]
MTPATRDVGIHWENAACAHLRRAGLVPVARNFTCRYGEIDLIMREKNAGGGDSLVFAEVRYRNAGARGDGLASVGPAKRAKLVRAAAVYLQAHPDLAGMPCRFDVVACSGTPENPAFDWIRSAFDAC